MGLIADMEIVGPSGTPIISTKGRVKVSKTTQDESMHMHTLYFSPLSAEDVGEYRCTGTLLPEMNNPSIPNRKESASTVILIIRMYNFLIAIYKINYIPSRKKIGS